MQNSNRTKVNLFFPEFIKEAFNDRTKHVLIRAGRRTGKTYNAFIWMIGSLMANKGKMGLWVDTTQNNLIEYVQIYVKKILGDYYDQLDHDKQKHTIRFPNGSLLHMRSAERPENMEGFEYDFAVLNEAGIILKKKYLWANAIQPMIKGENCKVKIVGTPKGINAYKELSELCEINDNWKEYHFTCEDSPFWTENELEEIRESVDSFTWKQEYMALFISAHSESLLSEADIKLYPFLPERRGTKYNAYMHIDCTHTGKQTSDYAAAGLMIDIKDKYYIQDYFIEKLDQEQQARRFIELYIRHKDLYNIIKMTYDEKSNQGFGHWIKKLALEDYKVHLPIQELKYPKDKISHFQPHVPIFRSGSVYINEANPFRQRLIDQLLAFPMKGVNDDGVDMMSGLLDNIKAGGPINYHKFVY